MKKLFNCVIVGGFTVLLASCGGGESSSPASGTLNTGSAPGAVTQSTSNAAPVANAGRVQNIVAKTIVALDGTTSLDANSDPLSYAWTLTSKPIGSDAVLANSTSAKPTFTADVAGIYEAKLIVNDGKLDSSPVTVTVTASIANAAPVANAGAEQSVAAKVLVTLDGTTSSDANGDPLTYTWTLTSKPVGSAAIVSPATSSKPTFLPDVAGIYEAKLIVNDGKLDSSPAMITVTASIANAAPVANAGAEQSVAAKALITLDGTTSSDANGDPLTYTWTLTSKPVGSAAVLSQLTSARPTFTADVAGTYVATLLVNDGKLNSSPSTTAITAVAGKYLGISYVARNGLSVILNSITTIDQGNNYNTYTISYTQTNETALAIDEATFKLYFKNDVPMPQYGFFNKVYPGTPVSRTYTFTQLKTSTLNILEYDQDNFFTQSPVSGSLQWSLPIPTDSVSQ